MDNIKDYAKRLKTQLKEGNGRRDLFLMGFVDFIQRVKKKSPFLNEKVVF